MDWDKHLATWWMQLCSLALQKTCTVITHLFIYFYFVCITFAAQADRHSLQKRRRNSKFCHVHRWVNSFIVLNMNYIHSPYFIYSLVRLSMAEQTKFDVGWGEETFLCIALSWSCQYLPTADCTIYHYMCHVVINFWVEIKKIEIKNSKQS